MIDHVIIGMGMSALGVLEGLQTQDNLSILVVDSPLKEPEFAHFNGEKKVIGQIGDGGNSDIWHGVISKLAADKSQIYNETFDKLINRYYPNISEKLKQGYSFIPQSPIRPKSIIKDKFSKKVTFLHKKLISIEILNDYVKLFFADEIVETKRLWLCTGTTGTFDILKKSNILNENLYSFDDHLVGYFGQIKSENILIKNKISLVFKGHFKSFNSIYLSSGIKMYLNLRPAHFSFKNIQKASDSRSFFSQKSTSIIKNLLTKFNFGLIIEALYNKFGLFIPSNIYNIVGHVEICDVLNYSKSRGILSYNEKSINFSSDDISEIKKYFGSKVLMSTVVDLAPGIHFMNLKKSLDLSKIDDNIKSDANINHSVFICSGLSIKMKSPEHPTFSLLVYSYLKAKNYLENKSLNRDV
jgi:hypothetical protein